MIPERLAMIYNPMPDPTNPGFGGLLNRAMDKLCQVTHFTPGEETEGYDHYLYIDDGPSAYMGPKCHPATFFAFDMVVTPFWYLQPVSVYFERIQNFDAACVTSTASWKYCQERGYDAKLVTFAADPEFHRPHDIARDRDWIAVWHNCGERIDACNAALARYPGGQVLWAGGELYAEYISRGKCALNWLRGDIVNMRAYEIAAVGTPLINTRHPDMAAFGFVEDYHYLGFDGIDEMLSQIEWVLSNPFQASAMASRAREFVLANHTYAHRAREIFA